MSPIPKRTQATMLHALYTDKWTELASLVDGVRDLSADYRLMMFTAIHDRDEQVLYALITAPDTALRKRPPVEVPAGPNGESAPNGRSAARRRAQAAES
jgi:hypothetical protein